jgi:3-hydroxyacyl-CoA dehydrogenase
MAPRHAILITNSSYIVSSNIADVTERSEMVKKEVEGFLINRIVRVIHHEAYWLLDMGMV